MLASPKPILSSDVTNVGMVAARLSPDPDVQVSILAMTLISVCKSLGIGRSWILRVISEKWDGTLALFTKAGKH